ncbi:MAG: hypothetical protein OSJ70_07820 [Bacilli bacterium]|nr:hypothetical protein [Bacilli bacterium]
MKLWKKLIIIFVIIADVITLTFFTPISFKTIIPSPYNFKQMVRRDDLTLEVKEESLTKEGVTIVYKNNTDESMSYGAKYSLEYQMLGDWFIIKPTDINPAYLLRLYIIESNSNVERKIFWENMYGQLHKGKYRIVHDLLTGEDWKDEKYTYVEFEIK